MPKKLIIFLISVWLITGCAKQERPALKKFSKSGDFFGSIVRVDVCYEPRQQQALEEAVDEIWLRFADIHGRLSIYDPASDLNRINHSYPKAVTVGPDTWTIISDSFYYNRLSRGEFDITIYPLLKLWKESEKKGVLPSNDQIHLVQQLMGSDKFTLLKDNQIRLNNPGTQLTIDSIADGYSGDEASRILRAHGFPNFLVDTTGELYAGGHNCSGQPWRIGVKDPRDPSGTQIVDVLGLQNMSATTSGNYEHFYTIDGKRYSHIISPTTGYPHNEIVSATVIAPNTEFSDFLSTALCLMDSKRGVQLIDSLGEGYASMVLVDQGHGTLDKVSSRSYKQYLVSPYIKNTHENRRNKG